MKGTFIYRFVVLFLLIFWATTANAQQYKDELIEVYNKEICRGGAITLDGGIYKRLNANCTIFSIKANGEGGELKDEKYVLPSETTIYHILYGTSESTARKALDTITIVEKPSIQVKVKDEKPIYCPDDDVELEASVSPAQDLFYVISADRYAKEAISSGKVTGPLSPSFNEGNSFWAIFQAYNACGVTEEAIYFNVRPRPDLTDVELILDTEVKGTFCFGCRVIPDVTNIIKEVRKNGKKIDAEVTEPSMVWSESGSLDEITINEAMVSKQVDVTATVKWQDEVCGAAAQVTEKQLEIKNHTINISGGTDCSPRIQTDVLLKPCRAELVVLSNQKDNCTIVGNPELKTEPEYGKISIGQRSPFPYESNGTQNYRWGVTWTDYSPTDAAPSLTARANYSINCPYGSVKSIPGNLEATVRVRIDTNYLTFKYEYCPDQLAELEISGQEKVVTIEQVELDGSPYNFSSLFEEITTDPKQLHLKRYRSLFPITGNELYRYKSLKLKVKFNVDEESCHFSLEKKETITLKDKGNCVTKLVMVPHTSKEPCIGDPRTLRVENAPADLQLDSIVISPHPIFTFGWKDMAPGSFQRQFAPYYAGAPAVASQKDSIEATAYYRLSGSEQVTLTQKFELSVKSCPPSIQTITVNREALCPACPGLQMRGTITFGNPTTDEKAVRVNVISTSSTKVTKTEQYVRGSGTTAPSYVVDRYLFGDMEYRIEVTYNEGDSLYTNPNMSFGVITSGDVGFGEDLTSEHIKMADICDVVKEGNPDTVCNGQTVDLYVYSQNFAFETLESIVWDNTSVKPVNTGIEDWNGYRYGNQTKTIKRFHYRVENAEGSGIYPFVLRTKIRDSVIERRDTLRIVILKNQRIFTQDTAYACEGETFNAWLYVDSALLDIDKIYPSDLNYTVNAITPVPEVVATLRHCPERQIKDSMVVIGEMPVYGLAKVEDTAYCPGDQVNLAAATNGRITWIKWRKFVDGGLSAPDTLCVDASKNVAISDVMGEEDCLYRFEARTTCPVPLDYVQLIEVKTKKAVLVEIIDNSACASEPLVLQTRPFLDSDVADSARDVKWFVDDQPYARPTVPPADSVKVRCEVTGVNGCKGSHEIVMYSYKLPELRLGISEEPDFSGNLYCATKNDNVRFTGTGADAYSWSMASNPGVEISTASDYILNVVADDTLYLVGTETQHNCSAKDSVMIILEPDSYVEKSDTIACLGEDFNIRIFRGTAENTTMTDPAGVIYPDFDCNCPLGIVNYDAGDTGVFVFTFTRKGCAISKEVHLRMFPIPQFEFVDTVFCEDDLLRLDVNTGLEPEWLPQSRFVWKRDGNELYDKVGEAAYTGKELSLSDSGFYNLEVYVDRCINQDSVRIYVDAHSHPAFTVDSFYCEGADFITRAEDQGEGSLYEWYSDNRHLGRNDVPQLELGALDMADSAYLTLTVYRGACIDDTSIFIHVRSVPNPVLVAIEARQDEQGALFYCEGMPMRIEASDLRTDDIMEWYLNGNRIEGADLGTFGIASASLSDGGTYLLKVARNGCDNEASLYVDVHRMPIPLVNDTFMCSGYVLELDAANPDYPGATFRWEKSGTAGSLATINAGGNYSVAMSYEGCDGSKSFWVEERPTPQIGFPTDTVMCQRDSILLTGPMAMDLYRWQDGGGEPDYLVSAEGLYSLYVEKDGCFDYAEVYVTEDFCSNLYFPSAFTPNGDGINDFFGPITTAIDEQVVYVLYIYNRNGEKVFESHSLETLWDGSFKGAPCPAGMYVYRCKAHARQNGRNLSTDGTVNLIR